ncbi:MAG: type II toxin-antitoxin system HicA family toxin [Bacteroidales bacterium]|nr:type II toxin-antitoxin system HicA family toxin [Bacteroidales bacterium]
MKWNEMRRLAEDNAWYLYRRGANHGIYRYDGRTDIVVISRHGSEEIKTGTFNKLRRQISF